MHKLLLDSRYAVRLLAKNPVFTAVAVVTLGFGIGLNTTLFSVLNAVALKPVPVRDSGRIVRLERWFASGLHGDAQYAFSYPEFRSFASHNRVFSGVIATSFPMPVSASLPEEPATAGTKASAMGPAENATVQLVSSNYLADLGARLILGRTFTAGDDPGSDPTLVLSYNYWQTHFSGDPQVVGKPLKINQTLFTVIGVAAREFVGTGNPPVVPDFWAPLSRQAQIVPGQDWANHPLEYELQVLGYLAPGVSRKQAQANVSLLEQLFAADHPNHESQTTTVTVQTVTFFGNTEDPRFKAIVALLMTIVGMVLVIACANLANMLLARSMVRRHEIGVRLALGATRIRLIRQLLTEGIVLALLGGIAGVLVSFWGTRLVWVAAGQFAGPYSRFVTELPPDGRVLAYTFLLSVATGVLFSLSPALRNSREDLTSSLKDAGTAFGHRLDRSHMRSILIATQIAISTLFLIVAGLLGRGLVRAQAASPGFEVHSVYPLSLPSDPDPVKNDALRQAAVARLRALPEVRSVAVVDLIPLEGTWTTSIILSNAGPTAPSETMARHVSPSFFETLGIPLVRGRNFGPDEAKAQANVAIVSAGLAHAAWPDEGAIGKTFRMQRTFRGEWATFEVVGVAGDVRSGTVSRIDPSFVYLPAGPESLADDAALIRINGDVRKTMFAIGSALQQVDGRVRSAFTLTSLEDGPVRDQIRMSRTFAFSTAFLAVVALFLATIGVSGVMAFLVSQREKEIGIHMALGATGRNVLQLMLLQGMRPVVTGAVLGMAGAFGIAAALRAVLIFPGGVDMFYGGRWFDPATFLGLSSLLVAIALLACYVPAVRATQVDPLVTLRRE